MKFLLSFIFIFMVGSEVSAQMPAIQDEPPAIGSCCDYFMEPIPQPEEGPGCSLVCSGVCDSPPSGPPLIWAGGVELECPSWIDGLNGVGDDAQLQDVDSSYEDR